MLCQNCGKNEVTFRYTQVINGVKKEMNLCDKCARELGLKDINFSMPISFSNFLGDFFNDYNESLLPSFMTSQALQCKTCGTTFDEFMNTGEFGCSDCYDLFEDRISTILKNLQGANTHVGRGYNKLNPKRGSKDSASDAQAVKEAKKESKLERLQKDLQKAIKDERYEDAAKIRDQIRDEETKKDKNAKGNTKNSAKDSIKNTAEAKKEKDNLEKSKENKDNKEE